MKTLRFFLLLGLLAGLMPMKAQTARQWRDSLETLNSAISREPSSTELRLRKAAVNVELGQWEYAVEEYGRVLQLQHDHLSALFFRAYAQMNLRRYDLAAADYESVLRQVPRHFEARLGLAEARRQQGRTVEALEELNMLVEMHPDSALAYAARAGVEHQRQAYVPALYDWDEALRLRPGDVGLQLSKVETLLCLKRRKEARRLLLQLQQQGVSRDALKEWFDRC